MTFFKDCIRTAQMASIRRQMFSLLFIFFKRLSRRGRAQKNRLRLFWVFFSKIKVNMRVTLFWRFYFVGSEDEGRKEVKGEVGRE